MITDSELKYGMQRLRAWICQEAHRARFRDMILVCFDIAFEEKVPNVSAHGPWALVLV